MDRLNRLARTVLIALFILSLGMASLSAGVHATYTPESRLYFKRAPSPFTSDSMFGTKLGQFKIWSDDGNIYTPVLTVTPDAYSTAIKMTGLFTWNPPHYSTKTDLTFNVLFLAYRQGSSPASGYLSQPYEEARVAVAGNIANVQGTSAQPYLIDVFLLNSNINAGVLGEANLDNPGQGFLLDSPYTFNSPFNPSFGLAIADYPNTNMYNYVHGTTVLTEGKTNTGSYVEVDSPSGENSGHGTTPIVDPGGMTGGDPNGNGGIIYGDEPEPDPVIHTLFSLATDTVPITLSQYTGTQVREINTASLQVMVYHPQGGETVNVNVTFTDDSPPGFSGFHLLHETPGPSIPYNLYWGTNNTQITKGVPIQWNNLAQGTYTKKIFLGRINEVSVNFAAEGSYKSIVTITITNRD